MKHLGLFEGIGGFSLAARWMGWETLAWVEKDEYCQKVLKKHFSNAKGYSDIKEFDGKRWKGKIDIITGGFPCQPFSTAGKRKGNDDDRALWSEMFRVIQEVQPSWVVGENVTGIISMDNGRTLESILDDLEGEGYKIQTFTIPACAVQAPHKRERVWIIANSDKSHRSTEQERKHSQRLQVDSRGNRNTTSNSDNILQSGRLEFRESERKALTSKEGSERKRQAQDRQWLRNESSTRNKTTTNTNSKRPQEQRKYRGQLYTEQNQEREKYRTFNENQFKRKWNEVASEFCRVDDGIPKKLDKNRRERLKALGNAIVPQVAYEIFKAIDLIE